MPAKDIGIDLGTRNSLVFSTGKGIVLREPSVVVYDKDTEKIRAIGEEARQMASHLTSNMEVIWPIVPETESQHQCSERDHGD